jgi:predicted ATPase
MSDPVKSVTIKGFKSIRDLEAFEFRPVNVLIGANGAGKSNFIGFFRLLRELVEEKLQVHIRTQEGGADACLFMGPKITKKFEAELSFGSNGYRFALAPTTDNRFVFSQETTIFHGIYVDESRTSLGSGHEEAKLKKHKDDPGVRGASWGVEHYVYDSISNWVVYHFHDTSHLAGVRRQAQINDNEVFRHNAENLAPFLYRIRKTNPDRYEQIRDVVRLAAPFFDDFKLRPTTENPDHIQLEWKQKDSDYPFLANQLSDGTLRFMCLATALLQPSRPATVLFDEPELGLHPYALSLLGSLIREEATKSKQLIISTQSVQLLNEFTPEDVIVVERKNGESTFQRLDSVQLTEWLQEYTLGELWQKNVLGARPGEETQAEHAAEERR